MITQLDAFPACVQDSPKLLWLRKHNLTLHRLKSGRWRCILTPNTFGTGRDEEECCRDFCLKTGVDHWNGPTVVAKRSPMKRAKQEEIFQ